MQSLYMVGGLLCLVVTSSEERKRQYSAMRRAIFREASPELVAKFTLSSDKERLLFLTICRMSIQVIQVKIDNMLFFDSF